MNGSTVDLGQGRISKDRMTEPITFPRKCYCGYRLKPGEFASYMIGRWVCINCCCEMRKPWDEEKEEISKPIKKKMKQAVKP